MRGNIRASGCAGSGRPRRRLPVYRATDHVLGDGGWKPTDRNYQLVPGVCDLVQPGYEDDERFDLGLPFHGGCHVNLPSVCGG